MSNAFNWRDDPRPSVFAQDPRFTPLTSGKSRSQTGAETIARETKKHGRNPGTIDGIGRGKRKGR